MTHELRFLSSLIDRAENRLAFQAALVSRLPEGSASTQAVSACEVLQSMSDRVISLRGKREELLASQTLVFADQPQSALP